GQRRSAARSVNRDSEQSGLLQLEQGALAVDAAGIAGELAVAADDAVARYDDGQPVGCVGDTDCARDDGFVAEATGDVAIRRGFAVRDAAQLGPDFLLEL